MEADVYYVFCRTLQNMYAIIMRDVRKWAEKRALDIDHVQFDNEDFTPLRAHHVEWIPAAF